MAAAKTLDRMTEGMLMSCLTEPICVVSKVRILDNLAYFKSELDQFGG